MKKLVTKVIAILVMCFSVFNMCVFAEDMPITVYLDGEKLEFDVNPVMEDGRTLVPMRVIFEALGADVSWDEKTWTATAATDDTTIQISIDDKNMYKNGELIELDVPARLINSRTLVPVRAVSEGMGAEVYWIGESSTVVIVTDNQKISFGTINENTYENPSIGFGVKLPDEWVYMNEEQILEINNLTGELYEDSGLDFESVAQYTLMTAFKERGDNIIVAAAPMGDLVLIPDEVIANNLIEVVKANLNYIGEIEEANVISRDFAGQKLYGYKIKYKAENIVVYCEQIIKKTGNYLTAVTLTSPDENYGDEIFPLFYAINK